MEERFYQPVVLIDADIAMVDPLRLPGRRPGNWGTNILSLLKREGRWRISAIADNGRRPRPEGWELGAPNRTAND